MKEIKQFDTEKEMREYVRAQKRGEAGEEIELKELKEPIVPGETTGKQADGADEESAPKPKKAPAKKVKGDE